MGDIRNTIFSSVLTKTFKSLWAETSPEKAIARARRLVEKGRHDAAAGVLRDALQASGEEISMRMELSRILIGMNQAKEAAEGLKGFLKAQPGEIHQVQDLLAWCRANHHEADNLNEVLAEHHVARRELKAAFDALENLGKEGLQRLLDARLAHLKRFLEKKPDSVPRSALPLVYLAGLIHEAMGEDPRAVEVYHRIIGAHPGEIGVIDDRLKGITARHFRSASLRGALAGIYVTAGRKDRAVAEFVSMAEMDPRTASRAAEALKELSAGEDPAEGALMGLVQVLKTAGEIDGLLDACRGLLERGAHVEELLALMEGMLAEGKADPRLHLLVGEAAARLGKISKAVASFGCAAEEGGEELRRQAHRAMELLLEERPDETGVAEALADQAIREGRIDAAVGYLDRLPSNPSAASAAASRLQAILMTQPDHQGACALMEKVAPELDDPRMAALFLRRRLREGAGKAREALERMEALMERAPQDPMVRVAAVEARAAAGDMNGAWKELQPLLDGTTGPDPALFHLMVHIGSASGELCREIAGAFSGGAPALANTPEGQFCLGEMAARAGDGDRAIEAFRSAASLCPAATAEVVAAARDLCGSALTERAAAALAEMLVDAGDFEGASALLAGLGGLGMHAAPLLDKIERAWRKDPDNAHLRLALAGALAAAGRTGHARKLIDEGIQKAGAAAPGALHLAAGDAWLRDGNLGEAVRSYSRAMAQDKSLAAHAVLRIDKVLVMDVGNAGAHLARGRGLLLDGNPREGVNSLLTSWSIKPALGAAIMKDLAYAARAFPLEPSVDLARAQIMLGQGEVEAATSALGAALRTSPSMAPEVLSRLQAIVRSHPSCAAARLHAARAWLLRGRCRESGEEFLAALELDRGLLDHVATGLAELVTRFPGRPEPCMARARMEEARGNHAMASEAWEAAAFKGADPEEACEALRRLAEIQGPHRGRTHLATGRAACHLGRIGEAAAAVVRAAEISPELLPDARGELDRMLEDHPRESALRMARVRILQAALEPEAALPDLEAVLDASPERWREIEETAAAMAKQGAAGTGCALIRARALAAGGGLDEAAELLEQWTERAEGGARMRMLMLRSRVERRRGDLAAARRWMEKAAGLAPDREEFMASLHQETRAAALAAARMQESPGDRWRALRALLDLGDAAAAEGLAAAMELGGDGSGGEGSGPAAAGEVLARIACLQGRHAEGARLLAQSPPSSLKSHVLKRAGRLVEAAACLESAAGDSGKPGPPALDVYRRLAAGEFLGEPGCLEAETRVAFTPQPAAAGGQEISEP